MKKVPILIILLMVICVVSISAMDWFSFSPALQDSHVLINGGIGYGLTRQGSLSLPPLMFTVDVPVSLGGLPFSFGGMLGYYKSKWYDDVDDIKYYYRTLIFMGRADFHFPFELENLDFYAGFSLGWEVGFWDKKNPYYNNYSWPAAGIHAGFRYFFTKPFGVYAELGIERIFFNSGVTFRF